MQTQDQKSINLKIKKSQVILVGSLLVLFGGFVVTSGYFEKMKDEVFADMQIEVMGKDVSSETTEVPVVNNLPEDNNKTNIQTSVSVDYSKYLGVLEIPKIGLKRGFYNIGSRYNNIQYNVTMVQGSTLPDVENGNLILMAHSGTAAISYFAYLYNLKIGDMAYVTYNGNKYNYKLVNSYDVEKNGTVKIIRSYSKTTLTLITCTKNNDTLQTVYIFELI